MEEDWSLAHLVITQGIFQDKRKYCACDLKCRYCVFTLWGRALASRLLLNLACMRKVYRNGLGTGYRTPDLSMLATGEFIFDLNFWKPEETYLNFIMTNNNIDYLTLTSCCRLHSSEVSELNTTVTCCGPADDPGTNKHSCCTTRSRSRSVGDFPGSPTNYNTA